MKNFNLAGHLGDTPTLKQKGDTLHASLRIAAHGRKDKDDWFWVVVFGPLAEAICKNLQKGDGIAVWGELRSDNYKGVERVKLIAHGADFFSKKKK
jgi:single-stranded DNA-binding protein